MKTSLSERLDKICQAVDHRRDLDVTGRLHRIVGLRMEAVGLSAALGSRCAIEAPGGRFIEAEVIGFSDHSVYLMSSANPEGILPGAKVIALGCMPEVAVGPQLLGRVIDGAGQPLDGLGAVHTNQYYPLSGTLMNPLQRQNIHQALDVGIRALNALLTVGQGQRIGLFAGSGVGKSVLLGMMTRYTAADIIVVGLIGERGREVKEFIEYNLGKTGLARSVVVAAPADASPLMRLQGAMWATSIAEYFRDQGAKVLLLVDSLTRFAQAQRELSTAVGEPPATKGYSPSVFTKLAQLVERAGNAAADSGSITAFYTVLAEGDDQNDPIADAARAILDGHIVLTRTLAEAGHFPAIDIEASVSRVMSTVADEKHQSLAQKFKHLHAHYQRNVDLINLGAYQAGSDPLLDQAIRHYPMFSQFLQQKTQICANFSDSLTQLDALFAKNQQLASVAEQ